MRPSFQGEGEGITRNLISFTLQTILIPFTGCYIQELYTRIFFFFAPQSRHYILSTKRDFHYWILKLFDIGARVGCVYGLDISYENGVGSV